MTMKNSVTLNPILAIVNTARVAIVLTSQLTRIVLMARDFVIWAWYQDGLLIAK